MFTSWEFVLENLGFVLENLGFVLIAYSGKVFEFGLEGDFGFGWDLRFCLCPLKAIFSSKILLSLSLSLSQCF